jgi:hypothetical protein
MNKIEITVRVNLIHLKPIKKNCLLSHEQYE